MPLPMPTEDELVALLRRTSLPTLLVEGTTDAFVYRCLEEQLRALDLDVVICGGRSTLLSVFRRRGEYINSLVVCLADRDMWLFTAIPDEYSGVVWTTGYSIENDAYAGSGVERLLSVAEASLFDQLLGNVVQWLAFEVEEFRAGREVCVAEHLNRVVPIPGVALDHEFLLARGYRSPTESTIREIESEYPLKLRGKTLFDMLVRFLSAPKRTPKHSKAGLLEMCLRLGQGNVHIRTLLDRIEEAFLQNSGNSTDRRLDTAAEG